MRPTHSALRAVVMAAATLVAACRDPKPAPAAPPTPTPPPAKVQAPEAPERPECDAVDDTDLGKVVSCAYGAKTNAGLNRFLSFSAKAEHPPGDFSAWNSPGETVTDIRVVKETTGDGKQYAAVSRTRRKPEVDGGAGCSRTVTSTWIKEEGHWRLQGGDRNLETVARKKFESGDYAGSALAAEQWLKANPFSVVALKMLGFARQRLGEAKPTADAVAAALAIDSKNSDALSAALSLTADLTAAEAMLAQFRFDDCELDHAVFNVVGGLVQGGQAQAGLELMDKYRRAGPLQLLNRISALAALGRTDQVPALLSGEGGVSVRELLVRSDTGFASTWCENLASILSIAGDTPRAREWAKLGLVKDPSNKALEELLRKTAPAVAPETER